jgi:hypothetical protein
MKRASMTGLLSLTSCHPDGGLGLPATPVSSGETEPPGRLPPAPGSYGGYSGGLIFHRVSSDPDCRLKPHGPEFA